MSDTEFTELDLTKEIDGMDGEEAKMTLSEFMESHQKNKTAYDELASEIESVESEYTEKLEDLEETISEFKDEKADTAAEYVNMPADLIASRFSLEEIEQIIEEGAENFSEEEEEEDDTEPDRYTKFSDRPEKGRSDSDKRDKQVRARARSKLQSFGFPGDE